ncbi:MAG: murein biosynthesis integral membrane protein MurJ [Actinomycetales bacterium]|nr:murein biosynthesis integral membrane protein MurJ [Actinomycetales bacterium]
MSRPTATGAGDGNIGRDSAAMAAGSVASRILGVVRQSLITLAIGQGLVANAFTTANTLPNIIYLLLAGGVLNSVLVPQIVKATASEDGGRDYTDRLITIALSGLLVVTVVATLGAGLLVRAYAQNLTGSLLELAVFFALITLPQIFFYGVYGLLGQVLTARGRFAAYGWAPAMANLVAIIGLLAFMRLYQGHVTASEWTPAMVWWFAGTATLSIVAQALILIVPLWRSGFRWRPRFGLRGVGLGTTSKVAGWALASLTVSQLGYLVASTVMWHATGSDEAARPAGAPFVAGTTIHANAILVFMVPHGLVVVSLLTALYPRISRAVQTRDDPRLRHDYLRGLTIPAVVTIPAAVAFVVFALPIMGLLFTSRDPAEVPAAAAALAFMAPALLPFGIDALNQRMFYAFETGRTAFAEQLIVTTSASLVTVGAIWLRPEWTVPIIGVAMVVSNAIGAAFGMRRVRRLIGPYGAQRAARTWTRVLLASAGAGYVAWGVVILLTRATATWGRLGHAATLVIGGLLFTVVYLLLARLLRIEEIGTIAAPVVNRLDRRPPGRHRPGD